MRRGSGNDSRASKPCVRVERDKRVSGEQYPAIGEQENALSVGVPRRGDHPRPARKVQDGTGLQLAIRVKPGTCRAPAATMRMSNGTDRG